MKSKYLTRDKICDDFIIATHLVFKDDIILINYKILPNEDMMTLKYQYFSTMEVPKLNTKKADQRTLNGQTRQVTFTNTLIRPNHPFK